LSNFQRLGDHSAIMKAKRELMFIEPPFVFRIRL
jgi:hypothetical protein